MRLLNRERVVSSAVLIAVAATLVLLAIFQYVWSEQAMNASTARTASLLRSSMLDWHMEFFRQFSDVCLMLRVNSESPARDAQKTYASRFQQWQETAEYPGLFSNLYILEFGSNSAQLLRLNAVSGNFEAHEWSTQLLPLRSALPKQSGNLIPALTPPAELDSLLQPHAKRSRRMQGPGEPFAGWLFDANIPALVHAIPRESPKPELAKTAVSAQPDWLVVEVDEAVLREKLLPDLAHRFFRGPDGPEYRVALLSDNNPRVIFASSPGAMNPETADAVMDVLGSKHRQEIVIRWPDPNVAAEVGDDKPRRGAGSSGSPRVWFPLVRENGLDPDWELAAWHDNESIGAQARRIRWRNLGINFGAMLLLAVSIAMLVFSAQRAQRLADMEINFVAAVSHELRTPLAVISSAADNLKAGVVRQGDQLTRYGAVIQDQARQLSGLVEQILLFAATRQGGLTYSVSAVSASEVIDLALRNTEGILHQEGVAVERDTPADLPSVMGERAALAQILQNLITNAVKYGGAAKWIGIRAAVSGRGDEVEISIQDRGMGIAESELPLIFDAFYRSPEVTTAQIHGTGLGLPLAKNIAESMGGRLTVSSVPGKGSTFVLHLRVAQGSEEAIGPDVLNRKPS